MSKATTAKFSSSRAFPLSSALRKVNKSAGTHSRQKRVDIVSPGLCDDVIQRLGPSIKHLKNCDILDVYPGVGLWSSKIHEYLQPRRHILLEPEASKYTQFLNPLIESSSGCQLLDWSPFHLRSFEDVFDKGHLPEQGSEIDSSDGINDNLLVIANLGFVTSWQRTISRNGPLPSFWLARYMKSMYQKAGYHRYGHVRLLAWLPEEETHPFIPKALHGRRRLSVLTETTLSDLTMVATPDGMPDLVRDYSVTKLVGERVARDMAENGIATPAGREIPPIALAPVSPKKLNVGKKLTVPEQHVERPKSAWHDEYLKLENDFENKVFGEAAEGKAHINQVADDGGTKTEKEQNKKSGSTRRRIYKEEQNPQYKELVRLRTKLRSENNHLAQVHSLVMRQLEEDERNTTNVSRDAEDVEDTTTTALNSMNSRTRARFTLGLEDYRATLRRATEPLLLWDRRPYEPLTVKTDEFYPKVGLSLLSFTPASGTDPKSPITALNTNERQVAFEYLLHALFHAPTLTLHEALTKILGERSTKELLSRVPSLGDTKKGGLADPGLMTMRLVTPEMLKDLTLALLESPFRPSMAVMLQKTNSQSDLEDFQS